MNILVTSIVDLERVQYNRIHVFLNHLAQGHRITALCLNAWWLEKDDGTNPSRQPSRDPYFQRVFERVKISYLIKRKMPPILQETLSVGTLHRLLRENFDLHVNYASLISGLVAARVLRNRGIPTVLDIPDDLPAAFSVSARIPGYLRRPAGITSKILLQANVKLAQRVTVITQALQSKYALPAAKSTHLPNGFDTELFKEYPAEETRRDLQIAPEAFVLGFVGTLGQEWVDFGPVYAAVRQLAHTVPDLKLLIVGNGEGLSHNRDMAAQYGIADRVVFTGYVAHEQVPRYISCMDVCTVPFKSQGLPKHASPIKLFEYLACERPVISTPATGAIEAVGENILYATDEEEWTRRIIELHERPALRARMGTKGREFVMRNYSWSNVCQKFEATLLEAVSRSTKSSNAEG